VYWRQKWGNKVGGGKWEVGSAFRREPVFVVIGRMPYSIDVALSGKGWRMFERDTEGHSPGTVLSTVFFNQNFNRNQKFPYSFARSYARSFAKASAPEKGFGS